MNPDNLFLSLRGRDSTAREEGSIAQPSESMQPLLQICDLVARSTETLLRRYCPVVAIDRGVITAATA